MFERTGSKPFELFMARPFYMFEDWKEIKDGNAIGYLENRLKKLQELRDIIWLLLNKEHQHHGIMEGRDK